MNIEFKNIKMAVTLVAAILLLLLYGMIFSFSGQDGETSAGVSYQVTLQCTMVYNRVTNQNLPQSRIEEIAGYLDYPVRKAAHFTEYGAMGFLITVILHYFIKNRKKILPVTIMWVFISATADELHQYFVPERICSFIDVCIDTAGGIVGFMLCMLLIRSIKKMLKSN